MNLPLDDNQNNFKKNKQILFQANLPVAQERKTEKLNIIEKCKFHFCLLTGKYYSDKQLSVCIFFRVYDFFQV